MNPSHIGRLLSAFCSVVVYSTISFCNAETPEKETWTYPKYEDYDPCAQVALYTVVRLKNLDVEWDQVVSTVGPTAVDGTHTLLDIKQASQELGLNCVAVRTVVNQLKSFPMPAILHVRPDLESSKHHFMTAVAAEEEGVWLLDPPQRHAFVSWERLKQHWTGHVMLFPNTTEQENYFTRSAAVATVDTILFWIAWFLFFVVLIAVLTTFMSRSLLKHRPMRVKSLAATIALAVLFIAVVIIGGATGVGNLTSPSELNNTRGPSLQVDADMLDFGTLSLGSQTVELPITNVGHSTLQIQQIEPSCSCTVVKFPSHIPAGSCGRLSIDVSVSRGRQSSRLLIRSNAVKGPKVLQLKWTGLSDVALDPPKIQEVSHVSGSVITRRVALVFPGSESARTSPQIKQIRCSSPRVSVVNPKDEIKWFKAFNLEGVYSGFGEKILHLRIEPSEVELILREKVSLTLKMEAGEQILELPIIVEYNAPLSSNCIVFSGSRLGELLGLRRRLRVFKAVADGMLSVLDSPDWLDCQIVRDKGGLEEVEISIVKVPPASVYTAQVVVGSKVSDRGKLNIQVQVFTGTKTETGRKREQPRMALTFP